ncbi:transcriptional repressor LexA [Patescibacteria group bacterium]|nr:transcriptional repressor LexA [Patescibacteria group bacterium]
MHTVTKRQKEIYDYVKNHIKEYGYSPTFDEIGKHFKLSASSTIHQHIKALADKGLITKNNYGARSIELVKNEIADNNLINIPLAGKITAGQPIEAVEETGTTIPVVKNGLSRFEKYFALHVSGDSMVDEGIFDGDIVVIKKQSVAENGQTVVAIIDDNEATLKKLYREDNRFRLQPANQKLLPIYRKEIEVRGVVVKIIRDIVDQTQDIGCRTLDLFAGVGGVRLGFEKAGFKTVFANDFEKQCKETYDLNFKDSKLIVEDIRKIGIDDLPEFDFLLAGFPCQAFSIAGYRHGFKDKKDRGNLFFDIARILEAKKPAGFLLENVKNLKGHDQGKTFDIISKTLKDFGYHIKSKVLNSMEYGNVPQNRERIYIVGFKNKKYFDNFNFPKPKKLSVKVTDLLEKNVNDKYYYNGKPLYTRLKNDIKEEGKVYQWRRKYVRENKKGVCPTLTANMGMGGHNVPIIKDKKGIRKLTPRECARLQGFPKNYKHPVMADSTLYKQFGNSVTVPVVEAVAKQIKIAISF